MALGNSHGPFGRSAVTSTTYQHRSFHGVLVTSSTMASTVSPPGEKQK